MPDRKRVYTFQPSFGSAGQYYLPYAAGALLAEAFSHADIDAAYDNAGIFFKRDRLKDLVGRLDSPDIACFCCYVWNFEYNKAAARLIKERYPDCTVIFGGHQVARGPALLESEKYIDITVHGEGEEIFTMLLRSFLAGARLNTVPNIDYRAGDTIVSTAEASFRRVDYASPYASGIFDGIVRNDKETEFNAVLETNRGCPYRCSYCDWGNVGAGVRQFPLERAKEDIRWIAEHDIDYIGGSDANFGIFKNDIEITGMLIDAKRRYGHPEIFQTSYAKNSTENVFNISRALNECGMSKGVTVSYQTLSPLCQSDIGRSNISLGSFTDLLHKYNAIGIPTYTELIMGLPGETYDSFVDGIDTLLRAGQHHVIYIHACEWLPCSRMAADEYMSRYAIRTVHVPLNLPHVAVDEDDEVTEYSNLVVSTYTMTPSDWVRMSLFSAVIQAFHHMGLLKFFSLYSYYALGVPYKDFYSSFIDNCLKHPDTVGGKVVSDIMERSRAVLDGGCLTANDERFGNITWPLEEYAYLNVIIERDSFYDELKELIDMGSDAAFASELIGYQREMLRMPGVGSKELKFSWDLDEYFRRLEAGEPAQLQKKSVSYAVTDPDPAEDWPDYARRVVWYGRKSGSNLYSLS